MQKKRLKSRLRLICKVVGHRVHARVGVVLAEAVLQNLPDLLQAGRVEQMTLPYLRWPVTWQAPDRWRAGDSAAAHRITLYTLDRHFFIDTLIWSNLIFSDRLVQHGLPMLSCLQLLVCMSMAPTKWPVSRKTETRPERKSPELKSLSKIQIWINILK